MFTKLHYSFRHIVNWKFSTYFSFFLFVIFCSFLSCNFIIFSPNESKCSLSAVTMSVPVWQQIFINISIVPFFRHSRLSNLITNIGMTTVKMHTTYDQRNCTSFCEKWEKYTHEARRFLRIFFYVRNISTTADIFVRLRTDEHHRWKIVSYKSIVMHDFTPSPLLMAGIIKGHCSVQGHEIHRE